MNSLALPHATIIAETWLDCLQSTNKEKMIDCFRQIITKSMVLSVPYHASIPKNMDIGYYLR